MTGFKSKKAAALDKLDRRGSIALARSLCYQINGAADDSDDMDGGGYGSVDIAEILSAEVVRLQAALAQPAQEPDVVMHWNSHTWTTLNPPLKGSGDVNLYYAPQRTWVGLTDDEDWEHIQNMRGTSLDTFSQGAAWAQAKLKDKNK